MKSTCGMQNEGIHGYKVVCGQGIRGLLKFRVLESGNVVQGKGGEDFASN